MEHVWSKIRALREEFEILREPRLLVPDCRLRGLFDDFAPHAETLLPNFMQSGPLRDKFAEKVAPKFGVNSQVIAVRLDRDGIWPAA